MNAIQQAVASMDLSTCDAFFCVTVSRDKAGNPVPTIYNIAPGVQRVIGDEMFEHLQAIALTLRKAYPPKEEK